MNTRLLLSLLTISLSLSAFSQAVRFADDDKDRGYATRPYLRYEAEPGRCTGNAEFLLPEIPYNQNSLQSEASNQTAASLSSAGDHVGWEAEGEGNGLSLRFSIPDSSDGKGLKGTLALYVNDEKLTDIELDSYWAWQYNPKASVSIKYPDNLPDDTKFARMKFDEVYVLLPQMIQAGDLFSLQKENDDDIIYTIDFVELEKVPEPVSFESIEGEKVIYTGDGSTLQNIINSNGGKTIYIPAGRYQVNRKLTITQADTKIVGAGMWYTEIYFSASPDARRTAGERGIESYADRITLQGMTLSTASNMRYFENNESAGSGKGLQGSFGKGSVISDLRIDHFECGGWIADYAGNASDGLSISDCRFRNNYADGINLCSGTVNAIVKNCSFRNNGDDDMASWSTGNWTRNNLFINCTAENNWRASSLGFFGGENNKARNIVIMDAVEGGARVNADFQGTGFGKTGEILLSDISIYRSGCIAGASGTNGDHWGNAQPSLLIQPGYWYDITNLRVENIDIFDTRSQALAIKSNNGKLMDGLELHNIHIDGVDEAYTPFFMAANLIGNGYYSNITFENCIEPTMSDIPVRFDFKLSDAGVSSVTGGGMKVRQVKGGLLVSSSKKEVFSVYNVNGISVLKTMADEAEKFLPLEKGLYIVAGSGLTPFKINVR